MPHHGVRPQEVVDEVLSRYLVQTTPSRIAAYQRYRENTGGYYNAEALSRLHLEYLYEQASVLPEAAPSRADVAPNRMLPHNNNRKSTKAYMLALEKIRTGLASNIERAENSIEISTLQAFYAENLHYARIPSLYPEARVLKEVLPEEAITLYRQTFVGENIGKSPSVATTHQILMDSPPHKANILNPDWNRLGLGILQSDDGYYLVSQEFSLFEVNTEKLINKIFIESNTTLKENNTLMSAAQKWAGIMATNQQTSTQINGQSINDLDELQSLSIGASTGSSSVSEDLEILVKSQLSFLQESNTEIGYATAKDQTGQIYFVLIYK